VFDFALKERMQNGAVSDWRFGLNGNPDPRWREVAVTFVDNHDTGMSPGPNGGQHHWPLPTNLRRMAYAFILTTPGSPTVFWPDMYDTDPAVNLHDYLRQLIAIRRDAGVAADSPVAFDTSHGGLVANVEGLHQRLIVALDARVIEPRTIVDTALVPALEADGGRVRIWHSGVAKPVQVAFECSNGVTTPGQNVYVMGASKELGEWDPARAIKLAPTRYPTWSGGIAMAPAFSTPWKCVVMDEQSRDVQRWQPGPDSQVVPSAGLAAKGSL
jgi:alpha-amylase